MARTKHPVDEMLRMTRTMDRMLNALFPYESQPMPALWRPPTDVYETEDQVVIKLELAGVDPEQIEISFDERILRINGTRGDDQFKQSYHCLEIPYGPFLSEVYLPGNYDENRIEAQYKDGFLTITLPKVHPEPRNIAIQR